MKSKNILKNMLTATVMTTALLSCAKSADSFSLLADSNTFKQSTAYVPRPIDILWVIDNSGSMSSSQTNLANNFNSFISRFQKLNYDFHMGVTTTDAYLADLYYHNATYSKLKDGVGSSHSGVFVMDKNTPNLSQTFITNILQGTAGSGDERAFSSFQQTLSNSLNSGFRRSNAFLAVIIVSDEDDFSHNDTTFIESYTNSKITPISSFTSFLDTLTNSTATSRNYSVNTISILDSACLTQLSNSSQKIGQRYIQLADATGGIKGSLCSNFGDTLDLISSSVISLSSTFTLDRIPVESSLVIKVNGVVVLKDANNGWTYDATSNSVTFHGTAVPAADANITIDFDPQSVII